MPKSVAIVIALVITLLVAPNQPIPDEAPRLGPILLGMAGEVALGFVLALCVHAVFAGIGLGAEIASQQNSLGQGSAADPVLHIQEGPLGILGSLLAGLVFVGLGLHRLVLETVAASFAWVPAGQAGMPDHAAPELVAAVGHSLLLGFQLAAPIVLLSFLTNVSVGILARVAPRMNAFLSIGMTLNATIGVAIFMLSLPWVLSVHGADVAGAVEGLVALVRGAR
jgi:flagellar biosynthetic protein FliR